MSSTTKTAGIIGGIAPPSTIDYYRRIIDGYRKHRDDYPSIIINSIDLNMLIRAVTEGRFQELADRLTVEIQRLVDAGSDFVALGSNLPHIIFDEVSARANVPMISIVEATAECARKLGVRNALLFGTRFTMEGGFYQRVFEGNGISVIVPNDVDRTYIHDRYMSELVKGVFLDETRSRMIGIASATEADVLVLGGTELPLLLRDSDCGMPTLDTTQIHVDRIVAALLC